jgi:integrase
MAKKTDLRKFKNTDLPRYVTKTARGFYLYKRRAPKGLAEELAAMGTDAATIAQLLPASGVWQHSLGSDPAGMFDRARELTAHYDALLAPDTPPAPLTRGPDQIAARQVIKTTIKTALNPREQAWRETASVIDQSAALPDPLAHDAMSLFRAQAFGGTAEAASLPVALRVDADGVLRLGVSMPASAPLRSAFEAGAQVPPRPTGADTYIYSAMQSAVDARIKEVAPKDSTNPMRLSALVGPLSVDAGHRAASAAGLRRKVKRFTDHAGDKPLTEYTHADLIAYRDALRGDGLKEASLNQYVAALKWVWGAAPDRWPDEYGAVTFPRLKLRRVKEDVQETRWKAFTDDQMVKIGEAMGRLWGPEADSRLTPSRRRAFTMAVKVMLYTGLRPVEVFHLTTENIVGQTIRIKYTKTHAGRTLPLSKHLSDLPAFLAEGGFKAELAAAKNDLYGGEVRGSDATPAALAKSLRRYFYDVREAAGITDPKQVLYSLKDTLVRRLQMIFKEKGIPVTYDTIRDVIGHKHKGALAHYVTLTGDMDDGLALIREALDAIEYW